MRGFVALMVIVVLAVAAGVAVEAPSTVSIPVVTPLTPAIRVLVTGSCPKTVKGYRDVRNPAAATLAELAPADPNAALICRYGSYQNLDYLLYEAKRLDRGNAVELAEVIDQLNTSEPTGTTPCSCPMGAFMGTVIAFAYRNSADVDLWYVDTGCASLDNGHLRAVTCDAADNDLVFSSRFVPLLDALAPILRTPR